MYQTYWCFNHSKPFYTVPGAFCVHPFYSLVDNAWERPFITSEALHGSQLRSYWSRVFGIGSQAAARHFGAFNAHRWHHPTPRCVGRAEMSW